MSNYSTNGSRKIRISNSDDDSRETRFSIQPRNSHKTKEERYRDKEKERDHERHHDRERRDDRYRKVDSRDHRDRNRRSPAGSRTYCRDEPDRRRNNHSDRNRRDRSSERDRDNRSSKSKTKSPDSLRSKSSRKSQTPNHLPDDGKLFDRILDPNYKKKEKTVMEVEDVEMSPVEMLDEEEVSTFTFDDACGPVRPSNEPEEKDYKSEGDPESRPATPKTPLTPDYLENTIVSLNETLSDDEDKGPDDKYGKTPDKEQWESMTENEQKLHRDAMKKRREQRHREAVSKLPVYYPGLRGCQHISEYVILNVIAEGTYGEVFRGKNTRTDEVVALKRFKMEKEKEGFPITALREINMLLKAGAHENIVNVKEILVGSTKTEVYMAMEYVEHDVKSLIDKMRSRNQRFKTGQQKTLMSQLLSGIEHMHKLWILHRDLKTSNLLISHSGILKIADFGLAREYGEARDIEKRMKLTPIVVTLWYRSPELLLEPKTYSTPVDMWSIGCIMAEFIMMKPMFQGDSEPNQVHQIFQMMGTPTEQIWPDIKELKVWNMVEFPPVKPGQLRRIFKGEKLVNETGFDLLNGMLCLNPANRLTASEALQHDWFSEHPKAVPPEDLPVYPAKSELNAAPPENRRKNRLEALLADEEPERAALLRQFNVKAEQLKPSGFQLRG
ncbi:Cyclin-dependent kinase 11.2 [Caenorhabditis elegans]|uniref:Cyclin-dependent kinase 11.2 n=1 Tax=Caenorhabditis elegans TaxID=6239 RepID=CD112_CAEEL|nr:Cyclin-dependent kinase 11.2 [Caenorhabditis elegans]Q23357.2 RecName: Full=Cyclin-dependent kinase 11.2 [Caenorhabditis elegans]CAA90342.2 Cyclin-dependent kinase 11.2 [Caenorhabditis elegans]|eukprot:NP_509746.2 Cyclin-Dependent Kinase family [Caenorhabditis elegans]